MSFIRVTDPRRREELIRDFIETRKRIKDNFIARKVGEIEYQRGLTKLFKPVTETQKTTAKEITDAQKATAEKITSELLPIKESIERLPEAISFPTYPALEMTEEEKEEFGPLASKYLGKYLEKDPNTDVSNSGIFRVGKKKFKIGSIVDVKIEKDDIIIKDIKFKGTPGLWRLLTSKNIPDKEKFNATDLKDYITIMYITITTYDKNNKRIGGKNDKMKYLIKPLVIALEEGGGDKLIKEISGYFGYEEETDEETYEEYEEEYIKPSTSGEGLKILPGDPNALIDRFDLLFSSQNAGHTGVRNEIVSILDELKRQRVINSKEYKKLNSIIKK